MNPLVGQAVPLDGMAPNGKITSASITIDFANNSRSIITITLDPARGHAATAIVHRGLNDKAKATMPICALVSSDRMGAPAASWCDSAGGSPAQVRGSVRLVASGARPLVTVAAKRTQRLHGVWD